MLLNELADERADRGHAVEDPPLCPGPQKYGSLWLRIRQSLRTSVEAEGIATSLPRNSAPDKMILRHVAALNTLRATASRSTVFVETILHQDESRIIRKVIDFAQNQPFAAGLRPHVHGILPTPTLIESIARYRRCALSAH